MSIDHISKICNSRIGEVILIGDNSTLLDYGYQFMGSLHTVDSKSQTPSFISLLFTKDTRVQLILFSGMLNQLHNWILMEPIILWVLMVLIQSYMVN